MNLFFWKKNKIIDVFANDLANNLYSTIQPENAAEFFVAPSKDKKAQKSRKKTESELENIIKQINHFRVINSLGVYGKARLHMKFADRLQELGYDSSLVKKINEHIMIKTP